MKYYSEILEKFFNTPEECNEAELQFSIKKEEERKRAEKHKEERMAREAEIAEAREHYLDARNYYNKLINAYYSDYGMLWTLPDGEILYKTVLDSLFNS